MYHTNPCVVSAFKYDGDLMKSTGEYYVPQWAEEAYKEGVLFYGESESAPELYIKSRFDDIHVPVGNYVALLPNNTMITMDPLSFEWIFEPSEDRG